MSIYTGVSGLQAASEGLNIISNNIANANTTGYKAMDVNFADVYASTGSSGGVRVAGVDTNYSQGSVVYTFRSTDLAISGGGFFVTEAANGQQYYTRAGNFETDKDGFLVNSSNQYLVGYLADDNGNPIEGNLQRLPINTSDLAARSTTSATIGANLDARSEPLDIGGFDPSRPDSYHSTTTSTVFDSQGNEQQVTAYYIKTDENTWEVRYEVNGEIQDDANVTLQFDENGELEKSFDANGNAHDHAGEFTLKLDFGNGTAEMNLGMDVTGISQYGNDFSVSTNSQNGYAAGQFFGVSINADGAIVATYSNGESSIQGYVALASFPSEGGLDAAGNTSWVETYDSGSPIIGLPGTGPLGDLVGGALESSNVDMSMELVDMIVTQSAYQANTKTISAFDQNTRTLMNTF